MSLFNQLEANTAAIIVNLLNVEADKVTREARFIEDLGADSLDVVEVVMEIENSFQIEISDEEAEKVATVADLFAVISVAVTHKLDATIRPVS